MEVHRKVASQLGGAESLRRQAELLTAARHPGVVELVGTEGGADRPVLVTVLVDGPTLAAPLPLTVEEVAGLAESLAATLADLHQLGIVHGAVRPEHVLVGPDGRPVLCGFGAAGRAGDEFQPSTDVAAFGRLLRRLATGPEARPLRRIAEAAIADDPAARPSAQEVAAEIVAAVPGARLPSLARSTSGVDPAPDLRSLLAGARAGRGRGGRQAAPAVDSRPRSLLLGRDLDAVGDDAPPADPGDAPVPSEEVRRPLRLPAAPRRRRFPARSAVAGVTVTVAVAALFVSAPWSSPAVDEAGLTTATAPTPSSRIAPPTSAAPPPPSSTTIPVPRSDCPTPAAVLIADVDGDGCLDALRYADGILEGAGVRWALGEVGDQIATGDWSCRGSRTVVLLRPSTGEVFRFDGWAVGAHDSVTGATVARVPGGQAVRAADVDRDGCHEVVVERGELPPQVVRLPRPNP